MKEKFNDKQGNRNRACKFGLVYKGKFYSRQEAEAANLAVFKVLGHSKKGKWSNTDWEVTTHSATLVVCMSPFDGWPEDLDACVKHVSQECKRYLQMELPFADAKVFFEASYPKTFARIMEKDRAANDLI